MPQIRSVSTYGPGVVNRSAMKNSASPMWAMMASRRAVSRSRSRSQRVPDYHLAAPVIAVRSDDDRYLIVLVVNLDSFSRLRAPISVAMWS